MVNKQNKTIITYSVVSFLLLTLLLVTISPSVTGNVTNQQQSLLEKRMLKFMVNYVDVDSLTCSSTLINAPLTEADYNKVKSLANTCGSGQHLQVCDFQAEFDSSVPVKFYGLRVHYVDLYKTSFVCSTAQVVCCEADGNQKSVREKNVYGYQEFLSLKNSGYYVSHSYSCEKGYYLANDITEC